MRKTVQRLLAAGLVLALTATRINAQEVPAPPKEEGVPTLPSSAPQEPDGPSSLPPPPARSEPADEGLKEPSAANSLQERKAQNSLPPPPLLPPPTRVATSKACPPKGPSQCAPRRPSLWDRFRFGVQDRLLGYPEEFHAPALGEAVNLAVMTQALNGVAARLMLYEYDFECGGEKLNLRGKDRLRQMGHWLNATPFALVVERTPYRPALAESRRQGILRELDAMGLQIVAERVVIGPSPAGQLTGVEAEILYHNLLQQTQSGPTLPPAGSTTTGVPATGFGTPGGTGGQR
jgi:hypothetical protein